MQTASGETAPGKPEIKNSNRYKTRRRGISPLSIGIAAFLFLIVLGVMGLVFMRQNNTTPDNASQTVADFWTKSRTATPAAQRVAMLKVEKVGDPVRDGKDVTVKVRVTNNIEQSAAASGTVTPNAAPSTPAPANVYNATITVFFYKDNAQGGQDIVGSGIGNVTDLKYKESKEVTIVASSVGDFTGWIALPDSAWTDKDPIPATATPASATGTSTPAP